MSSSESSYTWQQKWLAIAPKPFSLLSILGSSYILQHILSSKERRAQVYHHILIGLCTYDIIVSFTMFWGTWAIPYTPNIYLASGTQSTCNAQAFLQQLGVAVPIYTAELALYYFLVVVFGWKERQLQKIEIVLHFIPSALGWTSSIVGIATNTFTDSVFWCWYSQDASNLRFGFFYGITWACILLVCILMGAMYITVLMQERKVKKYQHPNNVVGASTPDGTIERQTNQQQQQQQQQRREKKATASKRIAAQAVLYSGSFFLTWLFASWARIYEMINGTSAPFAIEALFTIFSPLQGFFNFFIYCRPRYLRYRRDNPNFSIGRFICDCGGFISSTKIRMSSKRTSNSTVRIGYNPAVVNDSRFMTRLGTQRFAQRFHARSSKNFEDAKASAINGNDQHCQSSVMMKVADKGAGEIEQENDPCRRTSTVRFADGDIDMEEEEKVEETSEIP